MKFDASKTMSMLENNDLMLKCLEPYPINVSMEEFRRISCTNTGLEWLYNNHLKGKYSHEEIINVLGLVKHVLIPHMLTLSDPHSLGYGELYTMLTNVLNRFK